MSVRIVTDSTNYLPAADRERLGIERVSLWVNDGDEMRRETEVDLPAFYRRLADTRTLPTSSQPSPEELREALLNAASDGSDVLGVFMSSKMSGTAQAAELTASMAREQYPAARIEVLDTETNCMQEGFAVLSAAEVAAQGGSIDECIAAARATMARSRFVFSPATLEYLRRGGRIGTAGALLGSLLQIQPVLTVEDGITTVATKVRTRTRALAEMAARVTADVEAKGGLKRIVAHTIAEHEAAEGFAAQYLEPLWGAPVPVIDIGPVIGLHVGPAIGVVYETVEPLR